MKVMVTGVGGIVARNAVVYHLDAGHEVFALYRKTPLNLNVNRDPDFWRRLHLIQGDLRHTETFPDGIDTLVHAAATSLTPESSDDEIIADNIDGTRAMASWVARTGVSKVIYCSSLSVYGRPIIVPIIDENTEFAEQDVYGHSKYIGEELFRKGCPNADILSLRLPGIIGIGAERNWMAQVTPRILNNQAFSFFNPNSLFNNTLLATDLATFMTSQLHANRPGFDAVTLSSREPVPLADVIQAIMTASGNKSNATVQESPYPSFVVSIKRAEQKYGFAPMTTIDAVTHYVEMLKMGA